MILKILCCEIYIKINSKELEYNINYVKANQRVDGDEMVANIEPEWVL